ncbi:S-adenosyl-L-methionine-dependent methyltransferase [Aulographum hederae CBS 113979]|uniref:S-adenosyl-L-methionine-dependent methyltransferase n=1 Tax=Aulographum hederae CBS 113979 TaxID=1176131 RepID=A0A6G1GSJ5_9PEZI|nr:S-adenosyl-L-methionine-dependent methyltransferase [Aulographum hederae CBS 113979]
MSSSTYHQGHSEAVTRNHKRRSAEKDGAFVLPYLKPNYNILDVGCGPGTITAGFASYVPSALVIGIDLSPEVIEQAAKLAAPTNSGNLSFETGNVLDGLRFPTGMFDVVFCNQTLLHIPDPVAALKEMKRVCKPSTGLVACREGCLPVQWHPHLPGLRLQDECMSSNLGGRTGLQVHAWAREAGFSNITPGFGKEVHWGEEDRIETADTFVARLETSKEIKESYLKAGASEEGLAEIIRDLRRWKEDPDGLWVLVQAEVICRC